MLTKNVQTVITDAVRVKPRTVQEVSQLIDKNWRTADRYVQQIAEQTGLIAVRTFREGSQGALKIVYWNALDRAKGTAYQERLLEKIESGRKKEDFSAFDIYQFVPENNRQAVVEKTEFSTEKSMRYDELLGNTKQQLLLFSGNLSWMELGQNMTKTMEALAKKNVSIKVLTRVDLTSKKNTEAALAINQRAGWDAVEIRHCEQPLRAAIMDDQLASMKEVLSPQHIRELKEKLFVYYRISDPDWVLWLQKVFWHLWQQSIDAKTRLDSLKTLQS